jgi:hypothetical protein
MSRHDVEHGSPGWCAWVWDCLVEALERLALPAAQQVRLTWLGRIPDELALHFHEAWLLVPQLVERGWIGAEPRAALPAVDQLLTAMSDHDTPDRAVLWILAGLHDDACWARARDLAAQALAPLHPA